jgi:7-cyano-7-deazaguanine synthase
LQQNNTGILLSGGMDSIALAFWKKPAYSFTVDYGQKPAASEIQAAAQISNYLGIEHYVIKVNCSQLGSGDMTGSKPLSCAPVTEWWPYRNQLLITLVSMKAIMLGVNKLIAGSVATDNSHKDGTEEFYTQISKLIKYQEGNLEIEYPAINLTTVDLIKKSEIPVSVLLWAHSCHTSNQPCMICNGCKKYLYVLQKLGIE